MNLTILRFESLDSTNTEALNQARRGADEGLCIVAERQSAGRGRHGRTWSSPAGAGLYFTIVLRPQIEIKYFSLITLTAAVAVADVLREVYDLKPDIKWANDIHLGGKKICGILAEMTETDKGLAVVVGIGLNLKSANFPPEIAEIATSIEDETDQPVNKEDLINALTRFFAYFYDILQSARGTARILDEWARRSSYFRGKSVKVTLADETIFGTTDGLEENGALRVKTADGAIKSIQAGDVEQLRTEK